MKIWGLVNETLYKGLLTMHPTSSTTISDAINRLALLEERLQHAPFIPQEELLGLLVAGSFVISSIAEQTETTQFTEDEVALVAQVSDSIESQLEALYGLDFGNVSEENEGWDHPEWDN